MGSYAILFKPHITLACFGLETLCHRCRLSHQAAVIEGQPKEFPPTVIWIPLAEKALGNRLAAIEAFKNAERGRDAGIRRTARYELSLLESPNR